MFCNRCGKIIPPSMPVVNGNCPDQLCLKAPKTVSIVPKVISRPVVVVMIIISDKSVKVRDIEFEWNSKYVRPWK